MDCPICLSKIKIKNIHKPELLCSCVFTVHKECWDKWGKCLYCRNVSSVAERMSYMKRVTIYIFFILYAAFIITILNRPIR